MKRLKEQLLSYVLLCISFVTFAQAPVWIDPIKRNLQYNEADYVVGFASENNTQGENPAELLSRLENYAKGQVAEYILVTVRSEGLFSLVTDKDNFEQSFSSISHSASNLVLTGLKAETYYDKKKKNGYSLVYARRSDLLHYYLSELNTKLTESERLVKQANSLSGSDVQEAFKHALEALTLVEQIEQAQTVIIVLKDNDFEKDIQLERLVKLRTGIDKVLREVNHGNANTLNDACFFLARGIKLQAGALSSPMRLSAFTFQDTRMGSEFSNRINQSLTSVLVRNSGYSVIATGSKQGDYLLTGTYWKDADEIKLIATLRQNNGSIVATSEAILPIAWIATNRIHYLPENFEEAHARMRIFDKDEIIKGDLNVETWTNKGDGNLIFTEGEKLKFYVRANKECYIRFVYHLADNQSVLLLDNFYIAAHLANKVVEIPDEFVCAEPFGAETLQVNAQTEPFAPLKIRREYGYDFILETLNDLVMRTRGIKKVTPEKIDRAEKRIVFTTLKKM